MGYERVTAPFDGVVTERNVENGVFVTPAGTVSTPQAAGAGGNTLIGAPAGSELFRVARTDTIRVYLGVPQAYAPAVHVGLAAALVAKELPGREFPGRVARTANSVDAASRTLLTEVDVVNPAAVLLPGMYAQVRFRFDRPNPPILMPAPALIFRTGSPQAAVVGSDSIAHFHNLTIGRDYGTVMEVLSGLLDSDYVVAQPSDDLRDGQHIHAKREAAAPGGDTAGGPSSGQYPGGPPSGDTAAKKPAGSGAARRRTAASATRSRCATADWPTAGEPITRRRKRRLGMAAQPAAIGHLPRYRKGFLESARSCRRREHHRPTRIAVRARGEPNLPSGQKLAARVCRDDYRHLSDGAFR